MRVVEIPSGLTHEFMKVLDKALDNESYTLEQIIGALRLNIATVVLAIGRNQGQEPFVYEMQQHLSLTLEACVALIDVAAKNEGFAFPAEMRAFIANWAMEERLKLSSPQPQSETLQ